MIKALLAALNISGLFFLHFLLTDDVNVTQTVPSTMEPGQEYTIELNIEKGAVEGFAQVKMQIPEGMTASASSQKGASFTFKDQTARFVWYSLPSDESFTIKYKVQVAADASGTKTIGGKFSYVVENQPQTFKLEDANITISGDGPVVDNGGGDDGTVTVGMDNQGVQVSYSRRIEDQGNGVYLVSLDIDKDGLKGFARVKENIPGGFSAVNSEDQGSIFSFSDQTVKYIWTEVPSESTFTISYTLTADPGVTGAHDVDGELSYLINDETAEVVSDPTSFTVPETAVVDNGGGDDGTTTGGDDGTTTGGDDGSTTGGGDDGTTTGGGDVVTPTPPAHIACDRTITAQGDNKFLVELSIDKNGLEGFARVKEIIPSGFSATKGVTEGARFSFTEQSAKFVWTMLPGESAFKISYFLEADAAIAGDFTLDGEFSYVFSDETVREACGTTPFNVAPPLVVDNGGDDGTTTGGDDGTTTGGDDRTTTGGDDGTTTGGDGTTTGGDDGTTTGGDDGTTTGGDDGNVAGGDGTTTGGDDGTTTGGDDGTTAGTDPVTNINPPANGINYRVQICATHRALENGYFARKYKFNEPVTEEAHQGWNKFTVGGFPQYKDARNKREALDSSYDFPGPFVAAYNDGDRITVQEALLITNQTWVQ